jgi:uncharacterized protein (TIGR02594 family)
MSIIYQVAAEHLGTKEWAGSKHNPKVVKMFKDAGNAWVKDDETPWCAAFVGSVLAECGLLGTGKLNARSYMNWGVDVDLSKARRGDVVIFWRVKRAGWQGHVAFFHSYTDGVLEVLGGNQGNAVTIKAYPKTRLLGVRRAVGLVIPDIHPAVDVPDDPAPVNFFGAIISLIVKLLKGFRR